MNSLLSLSLHELSALIAKHEISPVEVTGRCLEQITQSEPEINAFITLTGETALQEAKQAEKEIAAGKYRGALHGIPLAIKDLFETKGVRTTAGSLFLRQNIPARDCFVVSRLRQQGAVFLGKLNMHEWALGVTNENPHYGACRNPWDKRRIPGGSSGGSAAALAAGMCFGALGTDTGGSIRIPSSLCGITGIKPTFGRVSKQGVIPLSRNLDHVGPMARQVEDLALILNAIAGFDSDDPYAVNTSTGDYTSRLGKNIRGWHIAVPVGDYFHTTEDEVSKAFAAAANTFKDLGAILIETRMPHAESMAKANSLITKCDAAAFHSERIAQHPGNFGQDVLTRLIQGKQTSITGYTEARHLQHTGKRWFRSLFEKADLLLLPTTPVTAPLSNTAQAVERAKQLTRFTGIFDLTGLPAISLPCGFTSHGLPIGLQIIAPWWQESRLLQAAYAYEKAAAWFRKTPLPSG